MIGVIAGLRRHPVKGLSPEPLARVQLEAGAYFPNDRCCAVEVGPSGFDPEKPAHIPKQRFAVLARFPSLARLRTSLNDATGMFFAGDAYGFGVETRLDTPEGCAALERFLQAWLGDQAHSTLRVLQGPAGYRFMDDPRGHVSILNLASVRSLGQAIGKSLDPLRFRANVLVEGLEPWAEDKWVAGASLQAGGARLSLHKPIVRCVATHVSLETGERDIDVVDLLRRHFGRDTMGVYASVSMSGALGEGDQFRV